MHSLDVDPAVRRVVPYGMGVRGHFTGRERCRASVVDVHPVRRCWKHFTAVEGGGCIRNQRPRLRVVSRFAGEVARFEFLEGGVDVVELEDDGRRDSLVGVGLDDAERFGMERLGRYLSR